MPAPAAIRGGHSHRWVGGFVADPVTVAGAVFAGIAAMGAPFSVYLAKRQVSLAQQQLEQAGGIQITVKRSRSSVSVNGSEPAERFECTVILGGPGTRHSTDLSISVGDRFRVLDGPVDLFHASSPPLNGVFRLTHDEAEKAYIHVNWVSHYNGGVLPQAIRCRLLEERHTEYWKWNRRRLWRRRVAMARGWEKVFRPKDLGKWCKTPNRPYLDRELPGWPLGRPDRTLGVHPEPPGQLPI